MTLCLANKNVRLTVRGGEIAIIYGRFRRSVLRNIQISYEVNKHSNIENSNSARLRPEEAEMLNSRRELHESYHRMGL